MPLWTKKRRIVTGPRHWQLTDESRPAGSRVGQPGRSRSKDGEWVYIHLLEVLEHQHTESCQMQLLGSGLSYLSLDTTHQARSEEWSLLASGLRGPETGSAWG